VYHSVTCKPLIASFSGKLNSKGIAEWKMSELDADDNDLLNHKEVRMLIRKFKRTYSPRKCGKTFFYYCDENHNFGISKNEWLTCLGIQETQGNYFIIVWIDLSLINCSYQRSNVVHPRHSIQEMNFDTRIFKISLVEPTL
jgi:hypothetical protein